MYKKIIQSKMYNSDKMSLGFRRFICLPQKWQFDLQKAACALQVVKYHDYIVNFFQGMTEVEYQEWVENRNRICKLRPYFKNS